MTRPPVRPDEQARLHPARRHVERDDLGPAVLAVSNLLDDLAAHLPPLAADRLVGVAVEPAAEVGLVAVESLTGRLLGRAPNVVVVVRRFGQLAVVVPTGPDD